MVKLTDLRNFWSSKLASSNIYCVRQGAERKDLVLKALAQQCSFDKFCPELSLGGSEGSMSPAKAPAVPAGQQSRAVSCECAATSSSLARAANQELGRS